MDETTAFNVEGFLILQFSWDLEAAYQWRMYSSSLAKSLMLSAMHLIPATKKQGMFYVALLSSISEGFSTRVSHCSHIP